jgi:hypothetical protein
MALSPAPRKIRLLNHALKRDGSGEVIGNALLSRAENGDVAGVLRSAEFVRLRLHQVLRQAGEAIKIDLLPERWPHFHRCYPTRRQKRRSWYNRKGRLCGRTSRVWIPHQRDDIGDSVRWDSLPHRFRSLASSAAQGAADFTVRCKAMP